MKYELSCRLLERGDYYQISLQKVLNTIFYEGRVLCGLHDNTNSIGSIHLTHSTEHDIAQLLLCAQTIVARFGKNLGYQVHHYVCAIRLSAALQVELSARAFVELVLLLE